MMTNEPFVQTCTGRAFHLISPTADMVDFEVDIAEALARIPRFNGHVRKGPYSVAQHCVMGADALFEETKSKEMAAAFLLHDAHEAYIGDIITPVAQALIIYSDPLSFQPGRRKFMFENTQATTSFCLHKLKHAIDLAIHEAAGIAFPLSSPMYNAIKDMDARMLMTERRHLLAPSPKKWGSSQKNVSPLRLRKKFIVWSWDLAADEYCKRLKQYVPKSRSTTA